MKQMPQNDEGLALQMRALAHPARLSILRVLAEQRSECCCTDVTDCLPLAQSTVSQHIKVLLDAGLIARQQRGTRNCYTLCADRLSALDASIGEYLSGLSSAALAARSNTKESA